MLSSIPNGMKPKLTPELAEFIGMHIGDGTLYKTNSGSLVWEMRGDLKEKEYYDLHVAPLLNKLFNSNVKPKIRSGGKKGVYGIQTTNKGIINCLLEFEIKAGKKINIRIPKQIICANNKIKAGFLRGYFDTDGCIRFDKPNKSKIAYYPRIEFCTISRTLRDEIMLILKDFKLEGFRWDEKRKIGLTNYRSCLAGKKKIKTWIKKISSNNSKHLKKFSE